MIPEKKSENRGGARAGAGRKRNSSSIAKDNERVKDKILPLAEAGVEVLGESYPMLMRRAVDMAMGDEETGRMPNVTMLKTLLEMLPKVVNLDESDKPLAVINLVQDHLDRVRAQEER